jgi:crotonobetainyl-CoA:carnitine CoA-transferase CaiB-like acyl-CoA transferase
MPDTKMWKKNQKRPLEGVRIADVTVVWAGPHVTQLLGEWGAEIIRVEPVNRIQPYSRGGDSQVTKEQAEQLAKLGQPLGPYPGFDPGEDRWNRNAGFNTHARNKKSVACDFNTPEGHEAFIRLLKVSDCFIENNVPVTIEKAGFTWDVVKEINPRLIMLRMPAFGLEGPYKNYRAFGTHVEGMIGHHYIRGYTDAGPDFTGEAFTADAMAGVMGALSIVMALRHRERTGRGQQIEMPLAESFLPVLGEFILDYTMNGRVTSPQGNTHPYHAPHNVYPTAGDDQWLAIDVATDEEFRALVEVLGAPELATDERFAGQLERHKNRDALDALLNDLTRPCDKEHLFRELQARGVNAAPIHHEVEALNDEQLISRDWFKEITMPTVGTHRYPGYLVKMGRTPDDVQLPPPLLGQHNEEIYLDLLGFTREEYDAMLAKGIVGTTYPPEVLAAARGIA